MKIVYDVSYIQRRMFGIGRAARELLMALLAHDRRDTFLLHGWSWSLAPREIAQMAAPSSSMSIARIPGPVKRWYWQSRIVPNLERLIGDFTIFHSTDPFVPPTRRPTIATLHDCAFSRHPEFFPAQFVRKMERTVRPMLERATAIIVPSHYTLNELSDFAPACKGKTFVVPWPIGPQFHPAAIDAQHLEVARKYGIRRPFMLFVGTVEPRKNVSTLLDAFEILSATHEAPALVVAGAKGWMSDALEARLASLSRTGRVIRLQHLEDMDLPCLYRLATLAVYPSLLEGFGLPVAEAMACGTPVLTSKTSALQEIAGEAAVQVDPRDPDAMALAIQNVLSDGRQLAELSLSGRQQSSLFTHENAAKRVMEVYDVLGIRS